MIIQKGDTCILSNVKGCGHEVIVESAGEKVRITSVQDQLCWIKILTGKWIGYELPCLVSRLSKDMVDA